MTPASVLDPRVGVPALVFEDVYRENVSFVWRSLRHLGVRDADIEDAMQDVFIVVNRKLGSFEMRSRVSTWIYGICLRVAHQRRRLAHERRELPTDPAELVQRDAPAQTLQPDQSFEQREAEILLDRILDTMPLEQRAAFTLFELDGCSCEQIAELTDAPLGTVYSRLRLAREVFRRATARLEAQSMSTSTRQGVR